MRWISLAVTLGVLLGSVAAQAGTPGRIIGASATRHPAWFKESFLEIAEDVQEAAEQGKHVMLFFYLEACPYCDKMVRDNFENSSYHAYLRENFDIIALNIRGAREVAFSKAVSVTEKELASQIKVRFTPTILFLDAENKPVLRLNGYRSVESFEYILRFVHEQAYRDTSLDEFIRAERAESVYSFRDHPDFVAVDDLAAVPDKPLAVIFESGVCDACDDFHERILGNAQTRTLLASFTVVRLNADSVEPLVGPDGQATTPRALAAALDLSYRPGVVLFDNGREIMRVDGMQRTFHFQQILRYVGAREYRNYPRYRDFARADRARVLATGRDINIWE